MTKTDFVNHIELILTENGYTKIKVYPALFGLKANVEARNPKGKKQEFKAYLKTSWGKTKLVLEPKDDLSWIDELEMLDAIFDDN